MKPAGNITISAQANRVNVKEGHTICLSLAFAQKPSREEIISVLKNFNGIEDMPDLPSVPKQILIVRQEEDRPQPCKDRQAYDGMSVSVGRIRACPILDFRMVSVSHNTLRGAASGSILNAELLIVKNWFETDRQVNHQLMCGWPILPQDVLFTHPLSVP